ncbi:hypothetical protein AWM79_20395 [Pseudomonas agarici]|uniref:AsnC family transcriptional regulator n=1 Tax=Pseudomonas agarici TaxID=46677 RepID=A0A0X1T5Y4_PSEAA|nr:hypothetical protein AWM79_20395 [Pseudomonas agarici]
MVFVTLHEGNRQAVEAFEAALVEIPQVIDAQRLYDDSLSTLPNVQRLTSTLVIKRMVQDRPLPL